VLSVSSLFLEGMHMGLCVCIRTHKHTLHVVFDVSPGVVTRHQEGPKNPDGLNLGICIRIFGHYVSQLLAQSGLRLLVFASSRVDLMSSPPHSEQ